MYELLILSFLKEYPIYAYMIMKLTNRVIGDPWKKVSKGTLSSLISKLEQYRFIVETDPKDCPFSTNRNSTVYKITPTGEKRFYELMMDTTSNLGTYKKFFHIKALRLHHLPLEDQLYLVNHYVNYCEKIIEELKNNLKETPVLSNHSPYDMEAKLIQLKINQWQEELTWIQHIHEHLTTRSKLNK